MRTSEIAKRYLDYFEKHGHLIVPSASLISPNPTTLFTIAGMVPFIPYLMGEQTPPKSRMASNQKCVRTLDIDEVGKTTRHGTFFQMLGNFSFGDYFKEEAIHYAYELLTTPQDKGGYGFDPEKLWMTTFTDDEEARSMWKNEGVDPEHIQIMGMEDNFWTTGGPGPGGPCSEIYVDRGPEYGVEGGPIADENRYIEIWDLVFENYEVDNVKSKTDLHIVGELENKNIDTGAGLERLAYLMQGKQNIYETDEVFPVIEAAQKLSGRTYGDDEAMDVRFRIVADHVRSALMIMSDGVRPSNNGRGYVLRRLLRRTVKAMRELGVTDPVMRPCCRPPRQLWSRAIRNSTTPSTMCPKPHMVKRMRSVARWNPAPRFSTSLWPRPRNPDPTPFPAKMRSSCTTPTASRLRSPSKWPPIRASRSMRRSSASSWPSRRAVPVQMP